MTQRDRTTLTDFEQTSFLDLLDSPLTEPADENSEIEKINKINTTFYCRKKAASVAFMLCPLCKLFPCDQLDPSDVRELHLSPLMDREIKKLKLRRINLFIVKYMDGTLKEVPKLDVNNPDPNLMKDVDTVYQIGKEYVPVIVLKPKTKDQRDQIAKTAKAKKS